MSDNLIVSHNAQEQIYDRDVLSEQSQLVFSLKKGTNIIRNAKLRYGEKEILISLKYPNLAHIYAPAHQPTSPAAHQPTCPAAQPPSYFRDFVLGLFTPSEPGSGFAFSCGRLAGSALAR